MSSVEQGGAIPEGWASEVLEFWFDELDRVAWFKKSAETDERIRGHFLPLYQCLYDLEPDVSLMADARTCLAAIVVFDQFPRNMFRDTPEAFASDGRALALVDQLVRSGQDASLSEIERLFAYLPFEHSEDLADQDRAVALISQLGDPEFTRYAEAHRDVIRRFGRFPHRNAILGRVSTPDEVAYLEQPGSGF